MAWVKNERVRFHLCPQKHLNKIMRMGESPESFNFRKIGCFQKPRRGPMHKIIFEGVEKVITCTVKVVLLHQERLDLYVFFWLIGGLTMRRRLIDFMTNEDSEVQIS